LHLSRIRNNVCPSYSLTSPEISGYPIFSEVYAARENSPSSLLVRSKVKTTAFKAVRFIF
jgi:hypothetical protein